MAELQTDGRCRRPALPPGHLGCSSPIKPHTPAHLPANMWGRSATRLSPAAPQSGDEWCKSGCFLSLCFGMVYRGAVDNGTVFIHLFRRLEPNCWHKLAKANLKSPTSLHPRCTEPSTILTGSETGLAGCPFVGAYGGLDVSGMESRHREPGKIQLEERGPSSNE